MDTLLRRLPTGWHVALSSRTRPKLNLLAYRAQGQLLEIGQENLRFSLNEARALLKAADLSDIALRDLADITEGWAIALQLSQLWLSNDGNLATLRSSFVDSIDGMAEYLAAEVFAALPSDMQAFLLETSICSRFNGDLADRERQRLDSTVLMDGLRALHGLANPLDGEGRWYRHHRIFAEFLDAERRRRLAPPRIAELHSCAADWFEHEGLRLEAVQHARASGNEARAVTLVEDADCVDICLRYGAPAVRTLLESLPPAAIQPRPRLRAAWAAMNLKLGSIAQAGHALAELQAQVTGADVDPSLRRNVTIVGSLRECFVDGIPSMADLGSLRRSINALASADWWVLGLMHNVDGRLKLRGGLIEDAVRALDHADVIFERGGSAHGHFFMLANMAVC